MFGQGNRDQTCETCWRQLPFGFKFLFLFTLGFNVLSLLFPFLVSALYFDGSLVVEGFQFWRLLFPYFPAGAMPMSIINILINFLWLMSILPPLEKKLSTSYILVETFLQNLMINLALTVISIVAFWIVSLDSTEYRILNYGLFPMCMIFIWLQSSQNPDQHTTFCCLPCLIPMKWIPVIILAFCLFLAPNLFLPLLVASVLGYLQFMHFKRRFITLPVKFYRKIDSILPNSITNRPDYVRVQNVEKELQSYCSQGVAIAETGSNPFGGNQYRANQVIEESNKVQVMGKGVSIGGGNTQSQNFKGFWASKAENMQIEPVPQKMISEQKKKSEQKRQTPASNEDYISFANSSQLQLNQHSPAERSQEQFQEKDEKKIAKENLLV